MLNKIKNFLLILIVCFFSTINVAEAQSICDDPYMSNQPQCKKDDTSWQYAPKVDVSAIEKANIEYQKQQGILKVTQSQIKSILNPISVLKDATGQYTAKLQTYAERLFWFLAVLTFTYQFGFMALKRSDVGELFAELVKNRKKELFRKIIWHRFFRFAENPR